MLDEETETAMVAPVNSHVDGKIWINSAEKPRVARFDKASGKFEGWTGAVCLGERWRGVGGANRVAVCRNIAEVYTNCWSAGFTRLRTRM